MFVVFRQLITILFVCICSFHAEQRRGIKHKPPFPTISHQIYWWHKIKIYNKDNSSRKTVPMNIDWMYVVLHHPHGKLIWIITTGHDGIYIFDKAVEVNDPKKFMEHLILYFVTFVVLIFHMICKWIIILKNLFQSKLRWLRQKDEQLYLINVLTDTNFSEKKYRKHSMEFFYHQNNCSIIN